MEDLEKILVIVKSIFTIIMFVMLSFINPIFIYIGGASIIIGGAIAVAFAFISAPISNESEVAKRREDIEKSPVDCSTPSVTDSKGDTE